jgi:sigma-B regulation protein RsbU (phosphoserine phosphatase)
MELKTQINDMDYFNFDQSALSGKGLNRYKNLFLNIKEYIYCVSYHENGFSTTFHSSRSFEVSGYTPEEYIDDPYLWFNMIFADDQNMVSEFLKRITTNLTTETIEHRIIHKNSQVKWVSNTCSAELDNKGNLVNLNGFIHDITSKKETELWMKLTIQALNTLLYWGRFSFIL